MHFAFRQAGADLALVFGAQYGSVASVAYEQLQIV